MKINASKRLTAVLKEDQVANYLLELQNSLLDDNSFCLILKRTCMH